MFSIKYPSQLSTTSELPKNVIHKLKLRDPLKSTQSINLQNMFTVASQIQIQRMIHEKIYFFIIAYQSRIKVAQKPFLHFKKNTERKLFLNSIGSFKNDTEKKLKILPIFLRDCQKKNSTKITHFQLFRNQDN